MFIWFRIYLELVLLYSFVFKYIKKGMNSIVLFKFLFFLYKNLGSSKLYVRIWIIYIYNVFLMFINFKS